MEANQTWPDALNDINKTITTVSLLHAVSMLPASYEIQTGKHIDPQSKHVLNPTELPPTKR